MKRAFGIVVLGVVFGVGCAILGYRAGLNYEHHVYLPRFTFQDYGDTIFAQGTWVIAEEKQRLPIQASDFYCSREWMYCVESTAILNSWTGDFPLLSVEKKFHEVASWGRDAVQLKPHDKECVRYTLTIDRHNQQVTGTRSTIRTSDLCRGVDLRNLTLRLMDGLESLRRQGLFP